MTIESYLKLYNRELLKLKSEIELYKNEKTYGFVIKPLQIQEEIFAFI